MEPVEIVITGLRMWVGVVMLAHGINHGRSLDGTAKWFGSKGFAMARRQAQLSAFGEIAIGAALVVGFLTSFAAFGVVAIMTVAFWSIHRFAGFFVFRRPDEGYEYVVTVALAAVVVATAGPGPLSLDALTGVADDLDGWTGLAAALGGLVAAAVQLALSWRKPDA
ncbi:MAG: DoxX family protein [Acidimicrobiia bacterium]